MYTKIDFRLRKDLDADLIMATANLEKKELNELGRNGLRLMLGIRTTRSSTITEKPLHIPMSVTNVYGDGLNSVTRMIPSKPAVFSPKKNVGGDV